MEKTTQRKHRPKFLRTDSNQYQFKRDPKWRKPKGIHNKMRMNKKGHRKSPSVGYRNPPQLRALDPLGYHVVYVSSVNDFKKIKEAKKQGALISGKVGMKKKITLLQEAKKLSIKVLNIKDIDSFVSEQQKKLAERKQGKAKREQKKEKFKKEAEKRAETTEKKEKEEKTAEEKEKEMKMEKKKILEGGQQTKGGIAEE